MSGSSKTGKKAKNPGHNLDPSASSTPSRGHADGRLVFKGKAFDCYMEDFKLLFVHCRGISGPLNQMIHEPTGHIMTVQILDVSSTNEGKMLLEAVNGFVVHQMDCPHIITIYGVMAKKEKVWICMEPMRAPVWDLFEKRDGGRIPEEVLREITITGHLFSL